MAVLLVLLFGSTVGAATLSPRDSPARAVEGKPIEAVICHVNDNGTSRYVAVRSEPALKRHLQRHPRDYRFGTKLGACELGGAPPEETPVSETPDNETPEASGSNILG